MKHLSISQSSMDEALVHIENLNNITPKKRGCLRLLSEEMFGMCKELLDVDILDFELDVDENKYVLRAICNTFVNGKAREEFLSISSSKENAANKGFKGLLGAIVDSLNFEGEPAITAQAWTFGMCMPSSEYGCLWSLSNYLQLAPEESVGEVWDGMEKSIIASFADDITVGVRSGKLEMAVTKIF